MTSFRDFNDEYVATLEDPMKSIEPLLLCLVWRIISSNLQQMQNHSWQTVRRKLVQQDHPKSLENIRCLR